MSCTIAWKLVYIVNTGGAIVSADLGNSSNYSNELQHTKSYAKTINFSVRKALKIVVGKVFLRVALM